MYICVWNVLDITLSLFCILVSTIFELALVRLYTKALLCSGQITFPETDFFVTLHLMNVLIRD